MSRSTRRLIFYAFVLVFLLITPPTILYSAGYSFDWQNFKIAQTGGVYLKTDPPAAQITVDGKITGTTPRLISRLIPRDYHILISRPGFRPWEKILTVAPQLVTEARNIFLFPEKIQPQLFFTNATGTLENYILSDGEKTLNAQAARVASTTAGFQQQDDNIFFVSSQNFLLYQTNLRASPAPQAAQISKESLPANTAYKIYAAGAKYFAAQAQNGILYLLNNATGAFEKIGQGIKDAQISDDNKKLLYFSDREIYVYFLEDILLQPYKIAGEKELITRYSQKISQAIFYPNNEYIAFVVGDQIKITELDDRGSHNTYDIFTAKSPKIYYHNDLLYILTDQTIYTLDLKNS